MKIFSTQKTKHAVKERERVMQHPLCILADVAPAAVPECRWYHFNVCRGLMLP